MTVTKLSMNKRVFLFLLLFCRYYASSFVPFPCNTRKHRYHRKVSTCHGFPEASNNHEYTVKRSFSMKEGVKDEREKKITVSMPWVILSVATICLWIAHPSIVHAVDHPADHTSLGVPIPVPDARYFWSGGICAAASHGVTVPLDVAKTRIQADPERYRDLRDAMGTIVKEEGPSTLLEGLSPTVVGYGIEGAAKFGLYESLKPTFAFLMLALVGDDPSVPYLAASVVAGAVASLLLCPLEQTRIRLVTDPSFRNDGLISGFTRLLQQEGPANTFFGGFPAMLSKQVPYTIGKQVSFDVITGLLYGIAATFAFSTNEITSEISVLAAFCASITACLFSHPGDVLLTATFKGKKDETIKTELPEFTQLVSDIWNNDGFLGFWTGLTARFFHVGAIITSQLVLYDFVKQLLGLPATGAH